MNTKKLTLSECSDIILLFCRLKDNPDLSFNNLQTLKSILKPYRKALKDKENELLQYLDLHQSHYKELFD